MRTHLWCLCSSSVPFLQLVFSPGPPGTKTWGCWEMPSLGSPAAPRRALSAGESEQSYAGNISLRVAFHSQQFRVPNKSNASLLFQHVSYGAPESGLRVNKRGPEEMWYQTGCVTSTTCTDPQQLQLLGDTAHFISKCRDSGINGNLLLLMNRSQIGINHVRFCPSRGHMDSSFPLKKKVFSKH